MKNKQVSWIVKIGAPFISDFFYLGESFGSSLSENQIEIDF